MRMAVSVGVLCALAVGCAAQRPAAPPVDEVLFSGSVQELAPHHAGDHFVYRTTSTGQPQRLTVEHVSDLATTGDFAVETSEDGVALGKMHLHDDGTSVALVSEALPREDVMILYEVPLPSLNAPLHSAERTATSPVTLTRLSDGKLLAYGLAEQRTTARRATVRDGNEGFEIHTERTIELPKGTMRLAVTTWITPGVGELHSEGNADRGMTFHRELICATVGGKRVGDCAGITQKQPES